jgi:hypothetical protein
VKRLTQTTCLDDLNSASKVSIKLTRPRPELSNRSPEPDVGNGGALGTSDDRILGKIKRLRLSNIGHSHELAFVPLSRCEPI